MRQNCVSELPIHEFCVKRTRGKRRQTSPSRIRCRWAKGEMFQQMARYHRSACQDRIMPPRAEPNRRSRTRSGAARAPGSLIVLAGAETSALDLMLTAVRRRMPHTGLEFPKRITTRRNGLPDAEIWVSRSTFRAIERDHGFAATWQSDGHSFALPACLASLLDQGGSVVIVAPGHIIPDLQETFPDVRKLSLAAQLDAARASLTPKACLRRIVGPRLAQRLEAQSVEINSNSVLHKGDFPSAIRALTEALMEIEQEHAVPEMRRSRQIPPSPKPRIGRSSTTPAAL